jgi:hypothetical protein
MGGSSENARAYEKVRGTGAKKERPYSDFSGSSM